MDFLKKIPVIARQHYEKLLLVLVMLGLAGAVFYLSGASQSEKEKVQEYFRQKQITATKGFEPANLAPFEGLKSALETPTPLNFSTPHNLFNPVKWQQRPDQKYIKVQSPRDIGPYALTVTAIRPLHMTIAYDRAAGTGYFFATTNEASANPREVRGYSHFTTLASGPDPRAPFQLKEARPPDDPMEFILELPETAEQVTVTRDQQFRRVVGHEADLRYDVEGRTFNEQREGRPIRLSGENYNIVAITPEEVVLSADSNDRRYAVKLEGKP